MTRRYAEGTTVPVERSKAEIEALLRKHGATGFLSAWDEERGLAIIQCKLDGRMIRFVIEKPDPEDYQLTEGGRWRNDRDAQAAADKEEARRWRAQVLIIKAKLEMIASGGSTVEREFLADTLLPDGRTVGEWITPQLEEAYETADMPPLLPGGSG